MKDGIWHFSASDDSLTPMGDKPDAAHHRMSRPVGRLAVAHGGDSRFRRLLANFWRFVAVFVPKYRQFARRVRVFTTSAGNLR
ncbi:hypothetical protein PMO31116_02509 [Pandoraea morbifera]|uniref:Uncharacterized protein n=1 Tax=Pandoraea morbifera TaxID=2508300 RepID=A0A5E4V9X5_9BURK|nr:hypothetical protein [Pandoraea morbifera]VVE09077.1 hypothetical protein PMO31116_02509 [Pandoraea morbifera]